VRFVITGWLSGPEVGKRRTQMCMEAALLRQDNVKSRNVS